MLAKRRKLDEHPRAGGDRLPESWSEEELSSAIQAVRDSCTSQILPHLVRLRKLLSLEYPPVEEVVDRGLAPRLIQLLGTQNDEIQIEVTWYVPCLHMVGSSKLFGLVHFGDLALVMHLRRSATIASPRADRAITPTVQSICRSSLSKREETLSRTNCVTRCTRT